MAKYRLVFSEVLSHVFEVEADNLKQAEDVARQTDEADKTRGISYDLVDSETLT